MDIPTNNPNLVVPPTQTPEVKESKMGPIVGIVIVIIVLIVGALYFWGERLNKNSMEMPTEQTSLNPEQPDPKIAELKNESTSDDYASIEKDLQATVTTDLDSDFQAATE